MPIPRPFQTCAQAIPLAILLAVAACGDEGGTGNAGADAGPDAAPLECSELPPLIIGQCIDDDTGNPCLDFLAPNRSWPTLTDQPLVHPIIGLQGSPMFVLSVSGAGIEPGMDSTSPYVELYVTDGEEDIGGYAARPSVMDDPNTPGNKLAPQLYVVSFFADDKIGSTVQVRAQARDLNEDQWCAEGSFEVGTLIDSPPLP